MSGNSVLPPNASTVTELYRTMKTIRRFDELAIDLRLAGEISGPMHPAIGQEAIAAGICSELGPEDKITSTHRGHAHCIAKGVDPSGMMAELLGRKTGICQGKGGSMHIADFSVGMLGANGIVGAGLPIALGGALASKLTSNGSAAVCFFGDGAAAAGPFHETLNIAALWQLPIVFVCESNGWASATETSLALAAAPAKIAEAYGIRAETVDGNDVLAMRETAARALSRARSGEPYFITAETYRMKPHAFRDRMPPESRSAEELASWARRDPLRILQERVAEGGSEQVSWDAVDAEVENVLQEAVSFAKSSPWPDSRDAMEGVFAE